MQRLGATVVSRRLDGGALGLGKGWLGRGCDTVIVDRDGMLVVASYCPGGVMLAVGLGRR